MRGKAQQRDAHTPIYRYQIWATSFQHSSPGLVTDATVAEIDWTVSEVMRVVEEQEPAENTLILFTSDSWPMGCPRIEDRPAIFLGAGGPGMEFDK